VWIRIGAGLFVCLLICAHARVRASEVGRLKPGANASIMSDAMLAFYPYDA
jgi:hypothetical protein